MAVPKRRTSKTKRDKRRASAWTLSAPELVKCSQ
ncbi:MAG TPA: 50S ribosomal protein L32, partial [Oscillospiraceae bacterium]|nr:50S ribosomal protein L32 [Oscillospiraceae bacterium]